MITALLKDTPTKERGEGPVFFPVEVKVLKNFNGFVLFVQRYAYLPPFWIFSKKSMLICKVDTDKLLDWKEKLSENPIEDKNLRSPTKKEEDEQNNNEVEKAALVNVNNTDIALFKYGEKIIGWFSI